MMKVFSYLLKSGLCLTLPVALSLAIILVPKTSGRSQTNQSDITGPTSTTTTTTNNNTTITTTTTVISTGGTNQSDITGPNPPAGPTTGGTNQPGSGTGGTNQSDITGENTTTTTTTTTISSQTGFEMTINRIEIEAGSTTTENTTTTETTNPDTTEEVPTLEAVSQPTSEMAETTEAVAPTPAPPVNPPVEETPVAVSPPVSSQPNPDTGGNPQTPNPVPTPTITQTVDLAVGSQRMFFVVPSNRRQVRGNAFNSLVGLANLSAIRGLRVLSVWSWGSWGGMVVNLNGRNILISLVGVSPGSSQFSPVLPIGMRNGAFSFVGVASGAWFDPPTAEGFRYTMTSDSLFTKIDDFPTGFPEKFTVSVGDRVLGEFGPGDTVDFTDFPGGGVEEFTLTGITPFVDPENPMAFPLKLSFNTETADFTMEAIQNPEAVAYYEENPPAPGPFKVTIASPDGPMEIAPTSTAARLREQADRLASAISDPGDARAFLENVATVERDLQTFSTGFETLLPQEGGLNASGLNPSVAAVERLRGTLPSLLTQLSALSDDASEEEAMAIATMIREVEGMTALLEAVTPMLNEMSESLAIAR